MACNISADAIGGGGTTSACRLVAKRCAAHAALGTEHAAAARAMLSQVPLPAARQHAALAAVLAASIHYFTNLEGTTFGTSQL
jgi:hypothetical protein